MFYIYHPRFNVNLVCGIVLEVYAICHPPSSLLHQSMQVHSAPAVGRRVIIVQAYCLYGKAFHSETSNLQVQSLPKGAVDKVDI